MEVKKFLRVYWPYIVAVAITLLTTIIVFNALGIDLNPPKNTQIEKVVTIENFETEPTLDTIPKSHNYDLNKTHETCKGLSNNSCSNASFCVLLDGEKCVGGSKRGPTYLTVKNEPVQYTHYIHKGKCKGSCK